MSSTDRDPIDLVPAVFEEALTGYKALLEQRADEGRALKEELGRSYEGQRRALEEQRARAVADRDEILALVSELVPASPNEDFSAIVRSLSPTTHAEEPEAALRSMKAMLGTLRDVPQGVDPPDAPLIDGDEAASRRSLYGSESAPTPSGSRRPTSDSPSHTGVAGSEQAGRSGRSRRDSADRLSRKTPQPVTKAFRPSSPSSTYTAASTHDREYRRSRPARWNPWLLGLVDSVREVSGGPSMLVALGVLAIGVIAVLLILRPVPHVPVRGLVAVRPTPEVGHLVPYVDKSQGFTLEHPANWTPDPKVLPNGADGALHRVDFLSSQATVYFRVDTYVVRSGANPEEEFKKIRTFLAKQYGAEYHEESFTKMTLAGMSAYRLRFVAPINGVESERIDVGAFAGQRLYALLAVAPEGLFKTYAPTFQKMYDSFHVAKVVALAPSQWDTLFKAGKVMVSCRSPKIDFGMSWDPTTSPGYAFHKCLEPVWSSADLSKPYLQSGVTPLKTVQTSTGALTLLAYRNSGLQGTNGATFILFYLQETDGSMGLVGAISGYGPFGLATVGGREQVTAHAPMYLGADPNCCPSVIQSATFQVSGNGLQLVKREATFNRGGDETQRLRAILEKRGLDGARATELMNAVAAISLDPGTNAQQKTTALDGLAKKWGEPNVSVVAADFQAPP